MGFLSRYLNSPLPYVRCQITVNKNVLNVLNNTFPSHLPFHEGSNISKIISVKTIEVTVSRETTLAFFHYVHQMQELTSHGAVAKLSTNRLVGTGFTSWYWLQHRVGSKFTHRHWKYCPVLAHTIQESWYILRWIERRQDIPIVNKINHCYIMWQLYKHSRRTVNTKIVYSYMS